MDRALPRHSARPLRRMATVAVLCAGGAMAATPLPVVTETPARLDPAARQARFEAWRANAPDWHPQVGERLWECAMCPEMIVAPTGAFTLGSPENEPGRAGDEGPQRQVVIDRNIAVSRFEVTRAEYEAFVARRPTRSEAIASPTGCSGEIGCRMPTPTCAIRVFPRPVPIRSRASAGTTRRPMWRG